jgi:CheY-like chemotaxis protein
MEAAKQLTVLVVEDYADTREALRFVLSDAGYDVVLAANGQEALDYLRNHPSPAVILLDMLMPVLDGWQFLDQLVIRGWSRPPIIIVTAVQAISPDWAEDHSCDGWLKKPVSMPELLGDIRRVVAA